MKYIKKYENVEEPQVGDYVLMRTDSKNIDYRNFLKNNVGQIIEMESDFHMSVKYENVPIKFIKMGLFVWSSVEQEYYHTFNKRKMLVFSDNPNDLELKFQMRKYNL